MKSKQQVAAEQATGCIGAGDYALWAKQQGYQFCEVWDWTSSAGNWTFLVSQDGNEWFWMFQTNNWPRPGFERTIDPSNSYIGRWEDVMDQIALEIQQQHTAKLWRDWQAACEFDGVDPSEMFVVFSEDNPHG